MARVAVGTVDAATDPRAFRADGVGIFAPSPTGLRVTTPEATAG